MISYLINFLKVKLHKLKRMLSLPREWLVLDIGSGNGPFPRADVLCDKYIEDTQRVDKLVIDRPFVIGDINALPFLDNSFDFIFCSHILEHTDNPEIAIKELMRVGKRGYIEAPTEFQEKMQSTFSHKWLIKKEGEALIFWEKEKEIFDECLQKNIRNLIDKNDKAYLTFFYRHHNLFNIEHYWEKEIKFKVLRRNIDTKDDIKESVFSRQQLLAQIDKNSSKIPFGFRRFLKFMIKIIFTKGKNIDLLQLLACPKCKNKMSLLEKDVLACSSCDSKFLIHKNIPIMLKEYIL
ncbi:MAG: type 11 SAM-dependent methyltransferase [Parcubacteria group bacterium Athens1014_10]|nr:MAG: type 11 SAM-dependent methyltransferase [Parcubacteria group bacterium Athens1014_10]TSD05229.1 MAG: type 11 SAM-dependent methyltransferase [Parcubacteria group bacterium Athens0714_12]